MRRRALSDVQDAYLRSIASSRTLKQCVDLLNERFGTSFTYSQIKAYKSNHHIRSGLKPFECIDHSRRRLTTPEQDIFLRANYRGISNLELMNRFNQEFNTDLTLDQIKSYKNRNRLNSGLDGQFEKGHRPVNKGKKMPKEQYEKASATMFKKGNVPSNRVPIGTEKIRADGYVWVKIQDGCLNQNWKLKHVLLWEKEHGPLPKGHVVIFLDGDTRNLDISNLKAIRKATNARMNQNHLRYDNRELTEAGVAVAELITTVHERKK